MRKVRYIALLLGITVTAGAQVQKTDTLQGRNVTIEREFTPILQDAQKVYSLPSVKSVTVTKDPVKYTYYSTTVTPNLTTKPLAAADIKFQRPDFFNGYARLGFGHNFNTIGDFGYKIDNGQKSCFDINIHHLGTFGRKQLSNTQVGFNFQQQVKNVQLYGDLNASHEWFNYYGRHYNDTLKYHYDRDAMKQDDSLSYHNRIWNLGFHVGVRSLANAQTQFFGELGYEMTNMNTYLPDSLGQESRYSMSEHRIHARGGASWKLSKGEIGFDGDVQVLLYSTNLPYVDTLGIDNMPTRGLVHLQPYYALTGKKAWLHLGVNMDLDLSDQAYFRVSPNIQTEWQAMPELFSIYANISGNYDTETWQSEMQLNRYTDPFTLYSSFHPYTPIDMEAGFKIKPIEQLQVNVYGRYAYTKDYDYNVAESDLDGKFNGLYTGVYANEQHAAVGLSVNFNWKENIRLFGDIHYNYYKTEGFDYSPDHPKLEAQLGGSYRINKHWAVQLDSYFAGKRYAVVETTWDLEEMLPDLEYRKLHAIYDINLGATYTLNRYISFFANLNNIANCRHEYVYGYEVQGINGVIGAAFQF